MNKKPRLFPVLVAVSLFLASGPLPAAAQVVMQAAALAGAAARVPGQIRVPAVTVTGAMSMPLMPAANMGVMQMAPAAPVPSINAVISAQGAPTIVRAGGDLAGLATEAAAYAKTAPASAAAKTATPAAEKVGRVLDVVHARSKPTISFDGAREKPAAIAGRMSLREQKPLKLPNGTRTDDPPTTPSSAQESITRIETYGLPGGRDIGGIFETGRKILSADPTNIDSVVTEVKAMIDADRAHYGVTSAELRLLGATPQERRREAMAVKQELGFA